MINNRAMQNEKMTSCRPKTNRHKQSQSRCFKMSHNSGVYGFVYNNNDYVNIVALIKMHLFQCNLVKQHYFKRSASSINRAKETFV